MDEQSGALRKDGKARPRLQGQPLGVLRLLLGRPGEVVTREELRQSLWPADTFVDYDHSLNTAVNKLRESLDDSADNPRFIQTIPRRGYRFIAAVEVVNGTGGNAAPAAPSIQENRRSEPPASSNAEADSSVLSAPAELPAAPRKLVQVLFSLIQLMYLSFYVIALSNLHLWRPVIYEELPRAKWIFAVVVVTALVGIPVRLYLLAAAAFGYRGLTKRFLSLFPALFPLDEFWALAPFLALDQISVGLALAVTAGLIYLPFSQRSLLLMGEGKTARHE